MRLLPKLGHARGGEKPADHALRQRRWIPAYAGMTMVFWGLASPAQAQTRVAIDASAPSAQAVTIYRDPNRSTGDRMQRDWPRGFAMISETRTVTLPPGVSTIRFTGVAEGMVAVSAIVTGLPGGTIEKNRNADLLSPAALVDGTLGNRVRVTRTVPGSGEEVTSSAIIRTRADGGLVLQTDTGFEAVRCSGIPERLEFDRVPAGLSSEPVFSIDTADEAGGTYTVTLSYLAWGFDWEANYVATFLEGSGREDGRRRASDGEVRFDLTSWLTILNDNNQSFENADLMAVAGTLNVTSDFEDLSDPPVARPLQLTCYPFGSTAAGSPEPYYGAGAAYPMPPPPPPPPPPAPMMMREMAMDSAQGIVVTGSRMLATEEDLSDLKLYRVPEQVTLAAQSLKQIAFLARDNVAGRLLYTGSCNPWDRENGLVAAGMLLTTVNDAEHGLGVALPTGQVALFEREMLVGEETIRDYASGQDVELTLGQSTQVFSQCTVPGDMKVPRWYPMSMTFTNATPAPVVLRLALGSPLQWQLRGINTRLKDGLRIAEITVPANGSRELEWQVRPPEN